MNVFADIFDRHPGVFGVLCFLALLGFISLAIVSDRRAWRRKRNLIQALMRARDAQRIAMRDVEPWKNQPLMAQRYPLGPETIPHRKNAAEWVMYVACVPFVLAARATRRFIRQ